MDIVFNAVIQMSSILTALSLRQSTNRPGDTFAAPPAAVANVQPAKPTPGKPPRRRPNRSSERMAARAAARGITVQTLAGVARLEPSAIGVGPPAPCCTGCGLTLRRNPRWLSLRETARLQGFPEWLEITCGGHAWYRLIGNAVSPPIVCAIAGSMLCAINHT